MNLSKSACLACLACSAAPALANGLYVSITPTDNLSDVLVGVVRDGSSVGYGALYSFFTVGSINAASTYTNTFNFTDYTLPILDYTVIGTYTNGSQGATIGFSTAAGDALIASSAPWPFDPPINESTFIGSGTLGYWQDPDQAQALFQMMRFNSAWAPAAPSDPGQLVNFSNATNGGSMIAYAVPEPANLAPLALGLLCLRRRQKRP